MKNLIQFLLPFLFMVLTLATNAQSIPVDSMFLGQTVPGNVAKIFPFPVTPGLHAVERPAITSDNKEIYYSELDTYEPNVENTKYFIYKENKWQGPFVLFSGFMAPKLTVNDSVMYLQKNVNSIATTFISKRISGGWSTPVRLLSTTKQTHYFQTSGLNNSFVSTNFSGPAANRDICKVVVTNNDTTFVSMGIPTNTSTFDENDFFVAYDESYMLLSRSSNSVPGDIFISYKKNDGTWTNPKSVGDAINTEAPNWEYGHFVTKDNKYLFFTRGGNSMSTYYIYWIKFDNIIDSLKHTNFIPYLKNPITAKSIKVGELFNFTVPDSTFMDDDGNNTLTYSATLSNGAALPQWLTFSPATRTFSGTPLSTVNTNIRVTAKDSNNAIITSTFALTVTTDIKSEGSIIPDRPSLDQNYPNPFNPTTTIKFSLNKSGKYNLSVFNILGKLVSVIAIKEYSAGMHEENFNAAGLASGMYIYKLTGENVNLSGKMSLLR